MKARYVLTALVAATFSVGASAQNLKPGLWEVTHNMKSSGGEMEKGMAQAQKEMANMPPEQRKMMEKMMAERGMKAGAGGSTMKVCMTREMVERNEMPARQGDCKTTKQERKGNTVKMAYVCTNPPSSGEGEYTTASPEAYTMKMIIKSAAGGKPETINMDGSGKWISADCGNVKPMVPPAKK
ncbi:MAG: hypothetical protein JWO70_631 [Betaproteobacteria bacterium]|nr:hypothetical protein [Betaproteobacteria bacterium]